MPAATQDFALQLRRELQCARTVEECIRMKVRFEVALGSARHKRKSPGFPGLLFDFRYRPAAVLALISAGDWNRPAAESSARTILPTKRITKMRRCFVFSL